MRLRIEVNGETRVADDVWEGESPDRYNLLSHVVSHSGASHIVWRMSCIITFLFVHSEHHNNLIAADSDELLYTSDTTSRKLRKQNHAINIIVLEQLDVGSHFGNLASLPV